MPRLRDREKRLTADQIREARKLKRLIQNPRDPFWEDLISASRGSTDAAGQARLADIVRGQGGDVSLLYPSVLYQTLGLGTAGFSTPHDPSSAYLGRGFMGGNADVASNPITRNPQFARYRARLERKLAEMDELGIPYTSFHESAKIPEITPEDAAFVRESFLEKVTNPAFRRVLESVTPEEARKVMIEGEPLDRVFAGERLTRLRNLIGRAQYANALDKLYPQIIPEARREHAAILADDPIEPLEAGIEAYLPEIPADQRGIARGIPSSWRTRITSDMTPDQRMEALRRDPQFATALDFSQRYNIPFEDLMPPTQDTAGATATPVRRAPLVEGARTSTALRRDVGGDYPVAAPPRAAAAPIAAPPRAANEFDAENEGVADFMRRRWVQEREMGAGAGARAPLPRFDARRGLRPVYEDERESIASREPEDYGFDPRFEEGGAGAGGAGIRRADPFAEREREREDFALERAAEERGFEGEGLPYDAPRLPPAALRRRRSQDSIAESVMRHADEGAPEEATLDLPPSERSRFERFRRMAISAGITPAMIRGLATATPAQHKIISALQDYSEEVRIDPSLFTSNFTNVNFSDRVTDEAWNERGRFYIGPHSIPPRERPIDAWGGVERQSPAGRGDIAFEGAAAGDYAQLPKYINDVSRAAMARAYQQSRMPFPAYPGKKVADLTPEEKAASDALLTHLDPSHREPKYEEARDYIKSATLDPIAGKTERETARAGMAPSDEELEPYMRTFQDNVESSLRRKALDDYREEVLRPLEATLISKGLRSTGARERLIRESLRKHMSDTENRIAMLRQQNLQEAFRHAAQNKALGLSAAQLRSTDRTRDAKMRLDAGTELQRSAMQEEAQKLHLADMLRMAGEQRRNLSQARINTAMDEWNLAHRYPMEQTERLLNMARSAPTNTAGMRFTPIIPTTTPQPSLHRQLAGLGMGLGGSLMEQGGRFKKGGRVAKAAGGGMPEMSGAAFDNPSVSDMYHANVMQQLANRAAEVQAPENQASPLGRFLRTTGFNLMASRNPNLMSALGEAATAGSEAATQARLENEARSDKAAAIKTKLLDILGKRHSEKLSDRKLELEARKIALDESLTEAQKAKLLAEAEYIKGGRGGDQKGDALSVKQAYKVLDKEEAGAKVAAKTLNSLERMKELAHKIGTGPSVKHLAVDAGGKITKSSELYLSQTDPKFLAMFQEYRKLGIDMASKLAKSLSSRPSQQEWLVILREGVPSVTTKVEAVDGIVNNIKKDLMQDLYNYGEAYKRWSDYGHVAKQYPSIDSLTKNFSPKIREEYNALRGKDDSLSEETVNSVKSSDDPLKDKAYLDAREAELLGALNE